MNPVRLGLQWIRAFRQFGRDPQDCITIGYSYYRNSENLRRQLAVWREYPDALLARVRLTLIDDGSPEALSPSIAKGLPLRIFRIDEDIPWNLSGAKNLIFHTSTTAWTLVSDLDQIISPETLLKILRLDRNDPSVIYILSRTFPDGQGAEADYEIRQKRWIPGTLFANTETIRHAGGYDEDMAGYYGYEDILLNWHLKEQCGCRLIPVPQIKLKSYMSIYDNTPTVIRDSTRNADIYRRKAKSGYSPGNILRFVWHDVTSRNA